MTAEIDALETRVKQEVSDLNVKSGGYHQLVAHWMDDNPLAEILAKGRLANSPPFPQMEGHAMKAYLAWTNDRGWMGWSNGKVWTPMSEAKANHLVAIELQRIFRFLCAQPDIKAEDVKEWRKLLFTQKAKNVAFFLKGQLTVASEKFDSHPHLINVQNGVVDLQTLELLPHDPALRLTKITRVAWDPQAMHVDWNAALRALPKEDHDWLQVRYGQAITGCPADDDRILIQEGHGANAKSTIVNSCMGALGDYAVTVSHKVLLANAGDHPTETMALKGARFAVLEELPEGGRMNDHQLKMLAGSAKITARRMRQDSEEFPATHSLIVNTNHMPIVSNADHSTWRRIVLLRFPYKFVETEADILAPHHRLGDSTLRERLMDNDDEQLEAVLAWLIEGAHRWYLAGQSLKGFAWPERVKADTEAWQNQADPILGFIQDNLIFDPAYVAPSTEVYAAFEDYLKSVGKFAWNEATFASRFSAHETVAANGVVKERVTNPKNVSHRFAEQWASTSGKTTVWKGVRFTS